MDTGVYIPIISDYGFKATFGNEADSLFLDRFTGTHQMRHAEFEKYTLIRMRLKR